MRWRDAACFKPKEFRDYFVWHPRWGRVVMCWKDGWGWDDLDMAQPERWLDESDDAG